ncbi:5-formyltetrahydrofolate cyclo-ligase [Marivirga atlantica]|jgi:5-formyltetrahydrofolate cyclo-ligase|uniref:5-formyltetrahydrofolate cyclo-ligase n=1 Tax=Marivirga atlantica TaxID=1548457 RepID=A0A937DFI2_9BACT|nr:5-formyltetrahydrofolate cyclo-ligase [Marivirga atlantica]MBL0763698.1 5-formyltetrahydrofolate cyclo-ligase [Marivirga atlantica]
MDKETLRRVYLEKRKTLTKKEYDFRNGLITNRLISFITENQFHAIHVFLPISKNREIDLRPFIKQLHNELPSVDVVTSISDLSQASMSHYKLEADTQLKLNKWGIPEPVNAEPYDMEKIDCVLVPMVIGSKTGHRIGYGKGYYDQFLNNCSENTIFVGLNIGPLLEGDMYAEEHDIAMGYMITPFQLFKINS